MANLRDIRAAQRSGREVRLASRPEGHPVHSDFELVECAVSSPGEGQLLVRNTWMSLDPSMRIRMHADASEYLPPFAIGAPLEGWAVGQVVESHADGYAEGDYVLHPYGWRDYALLDATGEPRTRPEKIAVDETTPERAYLGPLSWVGLTSYVGLFDVAEMQDNDIVFISGAAGAVGSLAVQIAKLTGHTVIGSAGSAEKVDFVTNTLGADAAFCYRDGDVEGQLRAAAPEGVDLYFDNVGGDHLQAALEVLRPRGRVALCGAISTYNATEPVPGPSNLFNAVAKGLTLRGFLSRMYPARMGDFRVDMRRWMADGAITYPETVFDRLEDAPRALMAQLAGENVGKVVCKIS